MEKRCYPFPRDQFNYYFLMQSSTLTGRTHSTGYSRPACSSTARSVSVLNFRRAVRKGHRFFLILPSALASRSNLSKKSSFERPCLMECRWIDRTERKKYLRRVTSCSWLGKRRICTGL